MALSEEQLRLIASNRKSPRPSFYSSENSTSQVISEDFEAYLILLSDTQKNQLQKKLGDVKNNLESYKDRDDIIDFFRANELTESDARLEYVTQETGDLDQFFTDITISGLEATSELGRIKTDLQISNAELRNTQRRMQHLYTFTSNLAKRYSMVSEDIIKEIESLIPVVQAYRGING